MRLVIMRDIDGFCVRCKGLDGFTSLDTTQMADVVKNMTKALKVAKEVEALLAGK